MATHIANLSAWVTCLKCNAPLTAGPAEIESYLSASPKKSNCPRCSAIVDWWSIVVAALERDFMFTQALQLMGARATVFKDTLKKDKSFALDLDAEGLPADARIVALNFTPTGPMFPAQIRQHFFTNEVIPHKLNFHSIPMGDKPPDEVDLTIMVTWFLPSGTEIEGEYFFDAFQAFSLETRTDQLTKVSPRWDRVIVPGNMALELATGRLVADGLKKFGLKNDNADYSHELNVLLPLIGELATVKPLPDHILKEVNLLRQYRNDVVHEGKPRKSLERGDAARLLAGVLFAFHYLNWFRRTAAI